MNSGGDAKPLNSKTSLFTRKLYKQVSVELFLYNHLALSLTIESDLYRNCCRYRRWFHGHIRNILNRCNKNKTMFQKDEKSMFKTNM